MSNVKFVKVLAQRPRPDQVVVNLVFEMTDSAWDAFGKAMAAAQNAEGEGYDPDKAKRALATMLSVATTSGGATSTLHLPTSTVPDDLFAKHFKGLRKKR